MRAVLLWSLQLTFSLIARLQVLPARLLPSHGHRTHPRALFVASLEHRPSAPQGVATWQNGVSSCNRLSFSCSAAASVRAL